MKIKFIKTNHLYPILFVCLSLFSGNSFALGSLGHKLVCQLSYQHLALEKQQTVDALLEQLPQKHKVAINRYNKLLKNEKITFATACTWADAIKKHDDYKQFKTWHYVNMPRNTNAINSNTCEKDCLPQAIIYHTNKLNKAKNNWEKSQALMFLGHWLGDIHQPLHVSFGSDLGGNRTKVSSPDGKCTNLHWVWDSCLLYRDKNNEQEWLRLLNKQWPQTSSPQLNGKLPVWQWANESFNLVRRPDLGYCIQKGTECVIKKEELELTDEYYKKFSAILQQRIILAAKRLTQLLEQTL